MVRSELIEALVKRQPNLLPRDVELAVNCIINQMSAAMVSGERIEIRGFGSFDLRFRPARTNARNPKTGKAVTIPAKAVLHFKPGKEMRDRVNATHAQCIIQN